MFFEDKKTQADAVQKTQYEKYIIKKTVLEMAQKRHLTEDEKNNLTH
jgi:hypothetical protein